MNYCVAERHGTPCPQPCSACDADCDPADVVQATNPEEAMRAAGWSEDYIAEVLR